MTLPSNRFMTAFSIVSASAVALMSVSASAALIEDYQFNDVAGTGLASLVNDADATADFGSNASGGNALADGAGNLAFTVGVDASEQRLPHLRPRPWHLLGRRDASSFTISAARPLRRRCRPVRMLASGFVTTPPATDLFLVRLSRGGAASSSCRPKSGGSNHHP